MAKLRVSLPIWLDRVSKRRVSPYPSLSGKVKADVVIVGGGVTGAAAAWMFAEAGASVIVVDRARIGCGSSAASTALLMQEPDKDFHELASKYGRSAARRIWQLSRAATRGFVTTLKRLRIACDLDELDSVYFTTDEDAVAQLRREHRLRKTADLQATWLDAPHLGRVPGITAAGAIRMRHNGQVDPYKACLGLLRAAEQRGARIFERSAVRRIKSAGS